MNRDDIIRNARDIATQCCNRMPSWQLDYAMQRIMELIDASAAAERETCADICGRFAMNAAMNELDGYDAYRDCEEAIRARGQQ